MKHAINAAVRFFLFGITALGMSIYANSRQHNDYWNGTIHRVQTVDFNILSHTLPTKISYALIERDAEEIQRTINSNFGLFGLVVTSCKTERLACPEQEFLYVTDSNLSWRKQLNANLLLKSDYDILRNPPPLYPEGKYESSRAVVRDGSGLINKGEIIGRVYYIRSVPPSFLVDYLNWVKDFPDSFFSNSGARKYYSLTTMLFGISALAAWSFFESNNVRHYRRKRESEKLREKLEQEAESLRQNVHEKMLENVEITKKWSENIALLKEEKLKQEKRELELHEIIAIQSKRLSSQEQIQEDEEKRQRDIQELIYSQQLEVDQLRIKIESLTLREPKDIEEKEKLNKYVSQLKAQEENLRSDINSYCKDLEEAKAELETYISDKEETEQLIALLRQQIEESQAQQSKADESVNELHLRIQELKETQNIDAEKLSLLEEKISSKDQEINDLKQIVEEVSKRPLTKFEMQVYKKLSEMAAVKSERWKVKCEFDVGHGNSASMFTDCILFGNSFVIVVEAKNYSGHISSEGDPRKTDWYSIDYEGKSRRILSSWGNNPYVQVTAYCNGVMRIIEKNQRYSSAMKHKIKVYGVVVFPENAELLIPENIEYYRRVVTLDNLEGAIYELEKLSGNSNSSSTPHLSSQDVFDLISGIRKKRTFPVINYARK
jgi:hypothetical protein